MGAACRHVSVGLSGDKPECLGFTRKDGPPECGLCQPNHLKFIAVASGGGVPPPVTVVLHEPFHLAPRCWSNAGFG
jgi:hypothetical protein